MANPVQQAVGIEQYLEMLRRRKWLVLVLFVVPFRVAVTAILLRQIPCIVTGDDRRRERFRFQLGAVALVSATALVIGISWVAARENVWLSSLVS